MSRSRSGPRASGRISPSYSYAYSYSYSPSPKILAFVRSARQSRSDGNRPRIERVLLNEASRFSRLASVSSCVPERAGEWHLIAPFLADGAFFFGRRAAPTRYRPGAARRTSGHSTETAARCPGRTARYRRPRRTRAGWRMPSSRCWLPALGVRDPAAPERLKDPLEIVRERREEPQCLTGARVGETEEVGVERLPA